MKVLILGSTGMLGNAVGRYFNNKYQGIDCTLTYRPGAGNLAYGRVNIAFDAVNSNLKELGTNYDYVINCIGTIKPFMDKDPIAARKINAVFPWELADYCNANEMKLIHITTDCVFSGEKGKYKESDIHDPRDQYGASKSLGEPTDRAMVIRTSIIGEEIHKNASLIEWAKSQKGKEVKGFTNHYWNGITTKQYAKVVDYIIDNNLYQNGLFHIFSQDVVSKFDMMTYFNYKFDLNLKITPFEAHTLCDRSLATEKELCSKLSIPSVKNQIFDL